MIATTERQNPAGRRRDRGGFTLIELLIVVVIIGILAAIGIPKFASTKERAYLSKMKGDLRNLVTAQEAFAADSFTYYSGAVPNPVLVYQPSSGVKVTITAASASGWAATASHTASPATCAVFIGSAPPPPPASVPGQVTCQ